MQARSMSKSQVKVSPYSRLLVEGQLGQHVAGGAPMIEVSAGGGNRMAESADQIALVRPTFRRQRRRQGQDALIYVIGCMGSIAEPRRANTSELSSADLIEHTCAKHAQPADADVPNGQLRSLSHRSSSVRAVHSSEIATGIWLWLWVRRRFLRGFL